MSKVLRRVFRFGRFQLDAEQARLTRDDETVPLPPKVFEILLALVESGGSLISKEELMRRVWPDTFVEENNLTVNISALRKALCEGEDGAKYIETVPRRGYRFVADVSEPANGEPDLILTRQTVSQIIIEEEEEESSTDGIGHLPASAATKLMLPASASADHRFGPRARWSVAVMVVVAIAMGVGLWLALRPKPIRTVSDVRSIAVLPFKSLGAAEEDESLGLGLADALITRLSNIDPVVVRPTSAIVKYAATQQSLQTIGHEQSVDALLDGRMQRAGERIRITVQLVRTDTGTPLWAEQFDERFTDIFAVQSAISERVSRTLALKLTSRQQQQMAKSYTQNTDAFQAYIKGRYFWNKRTPESTRKAIQYFEQAIDVDPSYALAYAGLADCYLLLGMPQVMLGSTANGDEINKVKAAALKALEIDEQLAEAHASLGAALALKDDAAAHREWDRAIELNPNYANAYNFYAVNMIGDGRLDEAMQKIDRALEIDPLSVPINTNRGIILYRLRRYDEAIEQFHRSLEMSPGFARARWGLGMAYEQKGMYKEAIAEFEQARNLSNGGVVAEAALAHAYAAAGSRKEAQQILSRLQATFDQGVGDAYALATVYAGLGDKSQALTLLESHQQEFTMGLLKIDQYFDSLRNEPRFQALVNHAGSAVQ